MGANGDNPQCVGIPQGDGHAKDIVNNNYVFFYIYIYMYVMCLYISKCLLRNDFFAR